MTQSRRWAIVNQGLGVNIWDTEQHAFWRKNRGRVASIQEEFAQTQGRPAAERKLEVANLRACGLGTLGKVPRGRCLGQARLSRSAFGVRA